MNEAIQDRLKGIRQWFGSLSTVHKTLLVGGALIVVVAVAVTASLAGPSMSLLFGDLQPTYAAEVLKALEARGVTYEVRGSAIYVPADMVDQLRMEISGEGILTGASDLRLFETPKFGITREQERRLMEETLAKSLAAAIRRFESVRDAEVKVSLGVDSPFASERRPSKVGVILDLKPNRTLTTREAEAIRSFVAAAVPNVSREDVVLTDTNQVELTPSDRLVGIERTAEMAAFVAAEESRLEGKVRRILEPAYGDLGFVVSVSAEYDFDQRERQTDIVGQGVPISEERLTDRTYQTTAEPAGAAGTPTNIPSYEEAEGSAGTRTYAEQTEERTNYEVSRTQEKIVQEPRLTRLSVSVHINKQFPEGSEEIDRITRLVEGAVGFSAERGDRIVVEGIPRIAVAPTPAEEPPAAERLPWYLSWWGMALIGAAVLLTIGLLGWLRRLLTASEETTVPVDIAEAFTVEEPAREEVEPVLEELPPTEPESELEPSKPEPPPKSPEELRREQVRNLVSERLSRPEEAAKVLRTWLKR